MFRIIPLLTTATALVSLSLAGCGPSDQQAATGPGTATPATPNAPASVLAYVDGTPITEAELEFAKVRIFGGVEGRALLAGADDKLLDSLVASRAIALRAEKELSAEEQAELANKVASYREELLVKHYLTSHVTAEPVTSDMVISYYDGHPEEFGGGVEKAFEYVTTVGDLSPEERHAWLRALGGLSTTADWQTWVAEQHNPRLVFRQAKARTDVLDEPLRSLVERTQQGATSGVHNGSQLTIIRVTGTTTINPRPLNEVRAEIRRKLAPVQLRKAVKTLSAEAVTGTTVEYVRKSSSLQQAQN